MKNNPFEQYSDQQIISAVLKGQKALYEVIIRRYNAYLYRTGRTYGYNHEDTEDLMQDTYLSAYRGLPSFENRASFKTWIVRIMLNHCWQKRHRPKLATAAIPDDRIIDKTEPMVTQTANAEKSVLNKELGHVLEDALCRIPESYRVVFSLRELNGFSIAETSETLQLSESNVKVRLNRAKALLRKEVEKVYTPDEIFEFNLIYCDAMVERVMKAIAEFDFSVQPSASGIRR
jgi:RNA polymerase sigma-70 factor (ECF subfamily)